MADGWQKLLICPASWPTEPRAMRRWPVQKFLPWEFSPSDLSITRELRRLFRYPSRRHEPMAIEQGQARAGRAAALGLSYSLRMRLRPLL